MNSQLLTNPARLVRIAVAVALLIAALVSTAGAVDADADAFDVTGFSGKVASPDGVRVTQAGAHPDVSTTIALSTTPDGAGRRVAAGNIKDVVVDLPPGLVGDPGAVPMCSSADLTATRYAAPECDPDTQVGVADLSLILGPDFEYTDTQGIFNVVPPRGVAARFAFQEVGVVIVLDARVTPDGQYHVTASSLTSSQGVAVTGVKITLWGVPADPIHDPDRFHLLNRGNPSSQPRRPFMTLPTACPGSPLTTSLRLSSWQEPNRIITRSFDHDVDGLPMATTGCNQLPFAPGLTVTPASLQPDAPTGVDAGLSVPQSIDPDGLATAHLKDVVVTLPEGMAINPGSAHGLSACSDAELGIGNVAPVACAESSKVGTVTATTPLLKQPLSGGVYVLSQASDDPESGELFRIGVTLADEERGVLVKLRGNLVVDADSGQITATFRDNPQLPVSDIKLSFKSGSRAPLVTPASCGTKTTTARLTSWAGHGLDRQSAFEESCTGGLGGFAPTFTAGTTNPVGGTFSPFTLGLSKPDGNAALTGLSMVLPTGLLAQLKDNVGTQVGIVKAFAGPGATPFVLPGRVYLEGPYKDAPFSLRVVVPAKAGPFDLGEVVVRQRIFVDPIDAHVTVVSDPLPTIVSGVPVRLQRLDANVDKPGFIINPTSCAPKQIAATLSAVDGQSVPITTRFQVGDCGSLALKPELGLSLSGKGQTTDGRHPAISATLRQPAGAANLEKVVVKLPLSLALDPDNSVSDDLCAFAAGSTTDPQCPKSSIVGTATAVTPILDQPLTGPVYFVKNERTDAKSKRQIKTLPKLVIPLKGNGISLTLTGTSNVVAGRLVTTFDHLPDAPVSSFTLNINGGKKGILVVSGDKADICKATQNADQQIDGHNAKTADATVAIQTPSCPLKVLSKAVGRSSVTVKVGGVGAGKVTIAGAGIRKTTRTIATSTVATVVAKRTKGRLTKVKVSFVAKGAAKAKVVTTTLR